MPFDPNRKFTVLPTKEKAGYEVAKAIGSAGMEGMTFGHLDEMIAGLGAIGRKTKSMLGLENDDRPIKEIYDEIKKGAEYRSGKLKEEYPISSAVSEVAGMVASPMSKALGGGVAGAAKAGALMGVGYSDKDIYNTLTEGSGQELQELATDVAAPTAIGGSTAVVPKVVSAGAKGFQNAFPKASKTVIKRVVGLSKKLRRVGGRDRAKLAKEIDGVSETILDTPGATANTVESNLALKRNLEGQNLENIVNEATSASGGQKIVDMDDFLKDGYKAVAKLNKVSAASADNLQQSLDKFKMKIKTGKTPRYQDPNEAWGTLKQFSKEADKGYTLGSNAPAMEANVIRRGVLRKVLDKAIEKESGPELAARLRNANETISKVIKAQSALEKAPTLLSEFSPTTREYLMLGLGSGGGHGTLGTLAGVSAASRMVPSIQFGLAKGLQKAAKGLKKAPRAGRMAAFGTAKIYE